MAHFSREELFAHYNRMRGDPYDLDAVPRLLSETEEELPCNEDALTQYQGTELSFLPVTVHPAFAERLARLERIAVEVGTEVYGRPPVRLRHVGAYVCRAARFRSKRISEHALGNAIDVLGFDFGVAKDGGEGRHLPPSLRWPFQVRVKYHWRKRSGRIFELHYEFLHRLTQRLLDEQTFRVALGPGHRGHANHFHFDMSPWRYQDL